MDRIKIIDEIRYLDKIEVFQMDYVICACGEGYIAKLIDLGMVICTTFIYNSKVEAMLAGEILVKRYVKELRKCQAKQEG